MNVEKVEKNWKIINEGNGFIINLPHVRQHSDWDCGIACLLMILNDEDRRTFIRNETEICRQEGFGKSIWTIDLAYLLKKFNVPFAYCTLTLGVDPQYVHEKFYKEKDFCFDTQRVTKRFKQASQFGVTVQNRAISLINIINHLNRGNPAIVLVNGSLLFCETCSSQFGIVNVGLKFLDSKFPGACPYHGHFVVLCGCDVGSEKLFYRNPDVADKVCQISFENFERARHSYGTDDDIIFIYSE